MAALVVPEKDIQSACLQWLNSIPGVKAWRQNRGAKLNIYTRKDGSEGRSFVRFGEPGASDSTGLANGLRLDIEFKRRGEVPTLEQENYLQMCRDGGGIAFWCDSLASCVETLSFEFRRRGWTWRTQWNIK